MTKFEKVDILVAEGAVGIISEKCQLLDILLNLGTRMVTKSRITWKEPQIAELIQKMLSGNILEIKPTLDLSSEAGFSYPDIEKLLGTSAEATAQLLEALAAEDILVKRFSDKIFLCPYCHSPNLRPSLRCPKCGSGYVDKARVLEHFNCSYVGVESEFIGIGKYICPRCQRELKFLGTDYRSLGIKYKCGNCSEIFIDPLFKWQCLGCLLLFAESEAREIPLYSYYLNESQRQRLEFELGPKKEFITFLQSQGYEVTEPGLVVGRSGAEHTFDIVARRTDGLWTHILAIDTVIGDRDNEVDLGEVFRFDEKTYDAAIHDKVLIVSTKLSDEASRFARRQRIKVLTTKDLESLLASVKSLHQRQVSNQPFSFESVARLVRWFQDLGYSVKEKAKVWGRSGVAYIMDLLAEWDDGIIKHSVAIGVLTRDTEVRLEEIALFDTKAYDIGAHEKVLLVAPRLSAEAKQFADGQGIKVLEVQNSTGLT